MIDDDVDIKSHYNMMGLARIKPLFFQQSWEIMEFVFSFIYCCLQIYKVFINSRKLLKSHQTIEPVPGSIVCIISRPEVRSWFGDFKIYFIF